jgi:hypothetical protein
MKNVITTCILFLGLTFTGFAQSDKIVEKSKDLVNQLNDEITSVDKSLALSEEQKSQIQQIQIDRLTELKKAKKEGKDKEANKEINQKYYQKIFKEVLTKPQMKARKQAKENKKED